jgi:outer membrane protein assembly factor BamB
VISEQATSIGEQGFLNNFYTFTNHIFTCFMHPLPYPLLVRKYYLIVVVFIFLLSCKKSEDNTEVPPPPPPPSAPTVITKAASSVTYNSAIIGGDVTNAGTSGVYSRGVCYSTSPGPTVFSTKIEVGSGPGAFTTPVTGLQANTVYYLKAFAYNAVGLSYGAEESFKTMMPPPQSADFAETIYIGNSNSLCAFNAQNGALKWQKIYYEDVTSTPMYASGRVYVTVGGNMNAYDTTGLPRWTNSGPNKYYNQSPIVRNNILFFAKGEERDISAYPINQTNINFLWLYSEYPTYYAQLEYGLSDIEVADNSVFINSGNLSCINATTGNLVWRYPNGGTVTPVRLNNKLYAISNDHRLFVLDLYTGQLLWQKADHVLFSIPHGLSTADGKLFYTDANSIYALDTINASVIWSKNINSPNTLHQGYSPIVTGDTGYFRTTNSIHLLNINTGNLIWQVPGNITSNMTVYDNIIYYGATEGSKNYLYAMDVRSGTLKWRSQYSSDRPFKISAPCVATKSGKVYRFGKVF